MIKAIVVTPHENYDLEDSEDIDAEVIDNGTLVVREGDSRTMTFAPGHWQLVEVYREDA